MNTTDIPRQQQELINETDGMKLIKLKDKFMKAHAKTNPDLVAEALIQCIRHTKAVHLRSDILLSLLDVLPDNDHRYSDFFVWSMGDPDLVYWGMDGLLKTCGKAAYAQIMGVARNGNLPVETRGKAIKGLCEASKQPFDRGLPADPGEWSLNDLRIAEIDKWENAGCPDGAGFEAPTTHPSLSSPKSELEKIVAKLERKLKKARNNDQDPANPSNWLVVANPDNLAAIQSRWSLPGLYLDFLTRFSPLKVLIETRAFTNGLALYGASELISGQDGYSHNPATERSIPGWPENLVVVGHDGADPYCIDCSKIRGEDAPVLAGDHGQGAWNFRPHSKSFTDFLKSLAA